VKVFPVATIVLLGLGVLALAWIRMGSWGSDGPVPRGAPPVRPRGLFAAGVLFATYVALLVLGAILFPPSKSPDAPSHRHAYLLDSAAKVAALLGVIPLLRILGIGADPGPAPARRGAEAGALGALAFLPIMFAIAFLQERVRASMGWKETGQNIVKFAQTAGDLDFALVFVLVVLLAPVFEETVFRFQIYSGLRTRMGPLGSAILSAALFALVHVEPVTFPVTFALGLCLAWIRERTGGRSAPIAMHACYNAVQMAGILALRGGGAGTPGG